MLFAAPKHRVPSPSSSVLVLEPASSPSDGAGQHRRDLPLRAPKACDIGCRYVEGDVDRALGTGGAHPQPAIGATAERQDRLRSGLAGDADITAANGKVRGCGNDAAARERLRAGRQKLGQIKRRTDRISSRRLEPAN